MIFLEYIGSRACLSAEYDKKPDFTSNVKSGFFYSFTGWTQPFHTQKTKAILKSLRRPLFLSSVIYHQPGF